MAEQSCQSSNDRDLIIYPFSINPHSKMFFFPKNLPNPVCTTLTRTQFKKDSRTIPVGLLNQSGEINLTAIKIRNIIGDALYVDMNGSIFYR
ncbi:hypothetical protein ES703_102970 [subsurface metagenome]